MRNTDDSPHAPGSSSSRNHPPRPSLNYQQRVNPSNPHHQSHQYYSGQTRQAYRNDYVNDIDDNFEDDRYKKDLRTRLDELKKTKEKSNPPSDDNKSRLEELELRASLQSAYYRTHDNTNMTRSTSSSSSTSHHRPATKHEKSSNEKEDSSKRVKTSHASSSHRHVSHASAPSSTDSDHKRGPKEISSSTSSKSVKVIMNDAEVSEIVSDDEKSQGSDQEEERSSHSKKEKKTTDKRPRKTNKPDEKEKNDQANSPFTSQNEENEDKEEASESEKNSGSSRSRSRSNSVYLENDEASSRSPSQNCSPKSNGKKSDASGDDEQVRSRNEKGSSKTSAKEEKNRKLSISDKSVNSDTHSIHSETENDDDDDEEDSTRSRTENPTHEIQRRLSKTKEKRERQRSSSSNSNDSLHKDSQKVMEIDNEELKNEKDIDNEEDEATSTNRAEPEVITYYCAIQGCRSVEEFECLNKIEEGAYGVVYRAKDKKTHEVVALKRLKMEKEKEGFPITSIREVDTLLKAQHPNVVTVREIVVGSNMDKIYMVMDFVEHDLKSLMQHGMKKPFLMSEVKTLMQQLLRGIAHLHDNWIIHRDLKTSNLLLSHKGVLKIADFGLAREYGSPLKEYTPIVVTLWYRCPELLLNTKKYSTSIDMWSVGCIFGELMLMKALFPGKNEKDQLDKIFKDLGTPTDKIWPGFKELPLTKKLNFAEFPYNTIRSRFGSYLSDKGFELINKLLAYDPVKRMPAEEALKHDFFKETPLPLDSTIFPTWPAKSEGQNRSKSLKDSVQEPKAPSPGKMYEQLLGDAEDGFVLQNPIATGFTLR